MNAPTLFATYTLDERIANCSASIASREFQGETLGWLYLDRGVHYLDQRDLEKAVADFTASITINPHDGNSYAARGAVYYLQGKLDLALADLDQGITLDPSRPAALLNRCKVHRKRGDYELALADCNNAITLDPNNPLAYGDRAILFESKKLDASAKGDFARQIAFKPNDPTGYRGKARSEMLAGEYQASIKDFDLEIRHGPVTQGAYHMRCLARAFAKDDLNAALEDCNRFVTRFPTFAGGYLTRGILELQFARTKEALADFDHVATCACSFTAHGYYGRSLAKRQSGDAAGADTDLAHAKSLDANVEQEFTNPETYIGRGVSTRVATEFR